MPTLEVHRGSILLGDQGALSAPLLALRETICECCGEVFSGAVHGAAEYST